MDIDTKKLKNKKQQKLKTTTGKRDEIVKNFWKTLFHTMSDFEHTFSDSFCVFCCSTLQVLVTENVQRPLPCLNWEVK
jgi:hypothetical protein